MDSHSNRQSSQSRPGRLQRLKQFFSRLKNKDNKAASSTTDGSNERNDAPATPISNATEASEHPQHQQTTTIIRASLERTASTSQIVPSHSDINTTAAIRASLERTASTSQIAPSHSDINTTASSPRTEPAVVASSQTTSRSDVSQKTPTTEPSELCPISELWNQAYESLKAEEEKLIKDYETILSTDFATALVLPGDILYPAKATRRDQMERILKGKVVEMKDNEWKLRFNGKDIAFEDLAKPVLGIVKGADKYVTHALSANPYASIAWAGVGLILPLFLNPSEQAASMAKGLKTVSDLIVQSSMREALYAHRYEFQKNLIDPEKFKSVHVGYRDSLQEQYSLILKFQAMCVCYYYRGKGSRYASDLVKWDNWDSSLEDIEKQDKVFCESYEILKDTMRLEEYDALCKHYEEQSKTMGSIAGDISTLKEAIEKAQSDQCRKDLLRWLSNIDPSENYRNALEKRKADTGNWLIQNHEGYESWRKTPNSFLWLHGKAGSGKSVLSSSIIESLENSYNTDPEVVIAYFYFSFNDQKKQNTDEMLCSLIRQIWCKRPDKPPIVEKLDQYEKKNHRPDLQTLKQALATMIYGFSSVYIVVDALDECPDKDGLPQRETLLETICELHKDKFSNVHLLCTSRSESDIEAIFRPIISSSAAIAVNLDSSDCTSLVQQDIKRYLDEVLASVNYRSWPDSIKAEAKDVLIEKAEGMFQYVACQLDILRPLRIPGKIREALDGLPIGLDATYDRILEAVKPENRKQVASILKWLCFSARPLLLDELAEIFILDHESNVPFDDKQRLFDAEEVLTYLPNLVTVIQREASFYERIGLKYGEGVIEIRFAHFSIQEYLLSTRIWRPEGPAKEFSVTETDANLHIAGSCLAYHLHLSKDILVTEEIFWQFKLWDYVVRFWNDHLGKVPRQSWPAHVTSRATKIFTAGARSLLNLIRIRSPDTPYGQNWELDLEDLASPLYYAASIDTFALTAELVERGDTIDNVSGRSRYGTALQAAAQNGNKSIVQLLLDRSADVNFQGGYYRTALQAAAQDGYESIVQLLLNKGANVNLQGGHYGNALQAAAQDGHKSIVQLLLNRGADVNLQGGHYGTALQAAAQDGYKSIVRLLLDRGADVNLQGGQYGNALQAAAQDGYESIVQLLLNRGADVNSQGGHYGNALQAAAKFGIESTIRLLLDRGADVNSQGGQYGNALQAATITYGSESIVELLLDRGADINLQGGHYGNALQAAALFRHESTVRLLLDRGADINSQGGPYRTALQAAAAALSRNESTVRLLLDRGADINLQGGKFGNALQAAVAHGQFQSTELLLSQGAKIDPPGPEWESFLSQFRYEYRGERYVRRLRKFQEDPTGFLAKLENDEDSDRYSVEDIDDDSDDYSDYYNVQGNDSDSDE